jgi:hypothetical protein
LIDIKPARAVLFMFRNLILTIKFRNMKRLKIQKKKK